MKIILLLVFASVLWFVQYALKLRIGALLWYIQKKGVPFPTEEEMREGTEFITRNRMLDLFTGRESSSATIRHRLSVYLLWRGQRRKQKPESVNDVGVFADAGTQEVIISPYPSGTAIRMSARKAAALAEILDYKSKELVNAI